MEVDVDKCILNPPFPKLSFCWKDFAFKKKENLFGKSQILHPLKMNTSVNDLLRKGEKRERERNL